MVLLKKIHQSTGFRSSFSCLFPKGSTKKCFNIAATELLDVT